MFLSRQNPPSAIIIRMFAAVSVQSCLRQLSFVRHRLLPINTTHTHLKMVSTSNVSVPSAPTGPLKVKKHSEQAFIPTRGSKDAAGYDLYSAYDCVVPARGKNLVFFVKLYNL